MKNLVTLLLAMILVISLNAQEKSVVRISNPSPEDFKTFYSQDYDIAAYSPGIFLDIVVSESEYNSLIAQGYTLTVTQTEKQLQDNLKSYTDLAGYRSYTNLLTELQNIEAAHPTICKLYDIGDSRGKEYSAPAYNNYKHDIWALKVSDNVASEEDEPCIFYMGEHHAREPISLEVAMYVLNHIVNNYGTDPGITASVNNKQIWFVPLVNPNGHKIVWDNVDTWWRKNIRDNNGSNTINTGTTDGVDPNRNYSWEWGGEGASHVSSDITYCGPSAFSEPEIMAMKNMLDSHHFVSGITYHSYSELVLFPYGYGTGAFAPDHNSLEALAVSMANTIPASGGGYYTPEKSSTLYPASGVTDDYAYGQLGIFSYTIELGTTFIPPQGDILGICEDNLQAAIILLNRVNQSTVTGLVKDANTMLPLVAEVYINGIDNTGAYREPYESDASFGRYFRFLQNGNYTVTFSAYGYIPQTFNNININSVAQTILNVNLVPAQSVVVTGVVTDLATGLPIEGATIEVLSTPILPVTTNSLGEYTISNVMEGTYSFRVSKLDYATIIQSKNVSVSNHIFNFQLEVSTAWSFETGVFEPQWTFGGSAPWYITNVGAYDGLYCSRSGAIGDYANSDMSVTLTFSSGGDISFFRKVSSEAGYDYLKFYIDGVQQGLWAGTVDWSEVSFPVTAGTHTMKWSYVKDANTIGGSDAAWVDFINFPPIIPPPDPADIVVNPGSFEVTIPADETTSQQMNISNIGDLDLTYSITKQYLENDKAPLAYCTASGGCDEYISSITFNTLTNTSGTCSSGGYADYTAMSTMVDAGLSYNFSYTIGTYYSTDDIGVWIDWNHNEVFTDAGENVICVASCPASASYSITVPVDALDGPARMRVRIKYTGTDCGSSCGTATYGEVEDYTVIVNNTSFSWLTVSPLNGTVTTQGTASTTLTFDSDGLAEGDYYANVKISSNDPDEPLVIIPCTLHVANHISLDLTAMLEGPFMNSEMQTVLNASGLLPLGQPFNIAPWNYTGIESVPLIPNVNVVDWVLIELRDATSAATATSATRIARQAVFILKDGSIVGLDGSSILQFTNSINQQLFVIVYHRNHLGILSASALPLVSGVYSYNFTSGSGQTFGANSQKQLFGSIYGMFSGDVNGNGSIETNDFTPAWMSDAGENSLSPFDLNLDSQINNIDKDSYWIPNIGQGVSIPE